MSRIKDLARLAVMTAVTLVASILIVSSPAEARFGGHFGGHGGFGGRGFHAAPSHMGVRPAFAPRVFLGGGHWRHRHHPRFVAAPVFAPYPVYGHHCVIRKRWVPGPFGWHVVRRRVCF
jgi:hypothetical protein